MYRNEQFGFFHHLPIFFNLFAPYVQEYVVTFVTSPVLVRERVMIYIDLYSLVSSLCSLAVVVVAAAVTVAALTRVSFKRNCNAFESRTNDCG